MPSITDIALGNSNFSILVSALQYVDATVPGSNLVATLAAPETSVTVFAPTNAAFGALAADLGYPGDPADTGAVTAFLVGAVPATTLRDVLLYHVTGGKVTAADVAAGGAITTLQGGTISPELPTLRDNEPDLLDPTLIATDIIADNGVVHVIDRVLLPIDLPDNDAPSLTEIVAASGGAFDSNAADFDILLNAVKTAGLADALNDPNADLTVFAPTDAAFVGLAQMLGYDSDDEGGAWGYLVEALTLLGGGEPIPLLTTVLTYHVAGESLQASQVLGSASIDTLAGVSLGVSGTALVDADSDSADATIIATDIQASNGVAHVIDAVLLPADLLASNGAGDVDFKIGTDRNERFYTGRDNDFVDGNGGHDRIHTGSGDDLALGGAGNDRISGGSGNDILKGEDGRDCLSGGRGDDRLDGGAGRDKIFGGSGNDVITGGADRDILWGGRGEDVFDFNRGDGRDYVADFRNGHDKIDLTDFGIENYHEIRDIAHSSWYRTVIDLGDDALVVYGMSRWNMSEDDFIF